MGDVEDIRDNLNALMTIVSKDCKCKDQGKDKSHQKTNTEYDDNNETNKVYKCEMCQLTLSRHFSLKRHNSTYHSETSTKIPKKESHEKKAFECNKCEMSFGRKDLLKKHSSRKHADPANPTLDCKYCQKKFISLYNLKDHVIKSHTKPTATAVSTSTD